ncbi:MAG: hypothetical protein ACYTXT_39835 [Nostoc sp.]
MTWKGLHPILILSNIVYQKGIYLTKKAMKQVESRLQRNPLLPKWDILIQPIQVVNSFSEITLALLLVIEGAIAMDFKQAGLSLLGGWIIGVVFMATKLPAPVPPLMGLMEQPFLFGLPQWSDIKVFSSRYGILTYASTVYSPLVLVKLS